MVILVAPLLVPLVGRSSGAQPTVASPAPAPAASILGSTATPRPTATPVPFGPLGPAVPARVARVIDGDTIEVDIAGDKATVRYIGIDAPEKRQADAPAEPFAADASRANAALVEGRSVVLEKDVSDVDRFGRLLRHVWLFQGDSWFLVSLELVRKGYAQLTTYPPDVRYVDKFEAAQQAARTASAGLWGTQTPAPSPTSLPVETPLVVIVDGPVSIGRDVKRFDGEAGTYRWPAVDFGVRSAIAQAVGRSTSQRGCTVRWSIEAAGERLGSRVEVTGKGRNGRSRRFEAPSATSQLTVTSDCAAWSLEIQEYRPIGIAAGDSPAGSPIP